MDFFEKVLNKARDAASGTELIFDKLDNGLGKVDAFIEAAYKEMGGNVSETVVKKPFSTNAQQWNDDDIFSEEKVSPAEEKLTKDLELSDFERPVNTFYTDSVKEMVENSELASKNNDVPLRPQATSASQEQIVDTASKEEKSPCSVDKKADDSTEKERQGTSTVVPAKKKVIEKRIYHDPEDHLHKYCIVKRRISDAENGIREEALEVPSFIIGWFREYYWVACRAVIARITDYSCTSEAGIELGFWLIHPNNDLEWKKCRILQNKTNGVLRIHEENESVSDEKRNEIQNELKGLVADNGMKLLSVIHCGGTAEDHSIRGTALDGYKDFWIIADWKNWNRPEEKPIVAIVSVTDLIDFRRKAGISPIAMQQRYWIYLYWNNLMELEKLGNFDISQDMGIGTRCDENAASAINLFHRSFPGWKIDETQSEAKRTTVDVEWVVSEEARKKQYKAWDKLDVPLLKVAPLFRKYDPEALKRKQAEEAAQKKAEEQKKIAEENARIAAENAERKKREQEERRRTEIERQRTERYDRSEQLPQPSRFDYQPASSETKKAYKTREANLYVSGNDVVLQPGDKIPELKGKVARKGRTIKNPPRWSSDKRIVVRAPRQDEFVYARYVESYDSGNAMFFVDAGSADKFRIIVYGDKNKGAFEDCVAGEYYWIQIIKVKQRDNGRNTYFGRRHRASKMSVFACENYKRQDYVFGPVSKDENGKVYVWLAPNTKYEIRSEEVVNELALREANDLGKANYVFRVKAVCKDKDKDGATVLDLRYAEEANLKAIAVERTYSQWNQLPDPDQDEIIFMVGDRFLDWINSENGQEIACAIIRFNYGSTKRFFHFQKKWEVQKWFLDRYQEAYDERRIHLRERNGRLEGDFELGVFNKKGVPQSLKFFISSEDYCKLIPIKFGFISVENTFSDLVYEPNWQKHLKPLSDQILKGEEWDYANTKNTQSEKYILRSYIVFAFYKAWLDDNIVESEHGAIFNTGLVNRRYEDIYCYLKFNSHEDDFFCRKWEIGGFSTEESLIEKFPDLPSRTVYIGVNNIGDVYLDIGRAFSWNKKHIIGERLYRFPIKFLKRTLGGYKEAVEICERIENDEATIEDLQTYVNSNDDTYDTLLRAFDTAVKTAIKFVEWDYRTCVTCYYARSNSLSLLLPIRLNNRIDSRPDLTLVIERTPQGTYYGHTVLSLAMAYQDARQIGRPASDWLIPSYIESLEADNEESDGEFEDDNSGDKSIQRCDDADDQNDGNFAGEEEEK